MTQLARYIKAPDIISGTEDRFHYQITDPCILCGTCVNNCPMDAIVESETKYEIMPEKCIDCGTCSAVCPTGAAISIPYIRESINLNTIDFNNCVFNPGCAMSLYKPNVPEMMLRLLREHIGDIKMHTTCCRHNPCLETGATIINNRAGCDRRFRSLYSDINTISYWEVINNIPHLRLPNYGGKKMSVHDSCGYRHKPQVHKAIRELLSKMNISVVETEFHGMNSVCCGDNYYGTMPDVQVEKRIKMRAEQFPCDDIVVYCIGCVRSMFSGGKTPHYLPDLLFGLDTEKMSDSLDAYHGNLEDYVRKH